MSHKTQKDLIRSICGGAGTRFGGIPCDFYVLSTADCKLLLKGTVGDVIERGRCQVSRMIKEYINLYFKKEKDLFERVFHTDTYGVLPEDKGRYIDSIAFMIKTSIKSTKLSIGHNLATLKGYINKTAYHEILKVLKSEGLIAKKKHCGNCIYLSEAKPYKCLRDYISPATDDNFGYEVNPYFQKNRNQSDPACKYGWKGYAMESLEDKFDGSGNIGPELTTSKNQATNGEEERFSNQSDIEEIRNLLRHKKNAASQTSNKKKFTRQHIIFNELEHLFNEGLDRKEAIAKIAKQTGKSEKTIYRDLEDIREFLETKMA